MYERFTNPVVVQKYGGTSMGTPERIKAVAARIARYHAKGYRKLAIVVSAMAGETNRLVDLVNQVNTRAKPQHADIAISAGEQVAVALLAAALDAEGILSEPLLGFQLGIFTDSRHSRAKVREIKTDKILAAWQAGSVPIIAGFQGITEDFQITTLGRGGSDTSAVALAAAVSADFCEINTDVDGMYSADPRHVPNAKLLATLDYNVALEMAALGSKVLHSRCVELAAKYKIPLTVRNSFQSDNHPRTVIMAASAQDIIEAPVVSGVSLDGRVARVALTGIAKGSPILATVFGAAAEQGINVDVIVHSRLESANDMSVAFTVADADLQRTLDMFRTLKSNPEFGSLTIESEADLAKLSIVGLGMQHSHGVAGRAFVVLAEQGIDIKMISTSEIKISCIVPQKDGERGARLLHAAFID